MKTIVSRANPTFKRLQRLAHSARERRTEGRTLLDGAHLVRAFLEAGGKPVRLIVSEKGVTDAEISGILEASDCTEKLLLADSLFAEASPVDAPTGLLAEIGIPPDPAGAPIEGSCLLLDAIQDTGNLGSILRTAAAAGVRDVFLTAGCAQAWSPRVLRGGMGAHFFLRIREHASPQAALESFKGTVIATRLDAQQSIYDLDLCGPVAWLFGNEGAGLSPEVAALATCPARIPMPGTAESLNVAAAVAVCLFQAVRQGSLAAVG